MDTLPQVGEGRSSWGAGEQPPLHSKALTSPCSVKPRVAKGRKCSRRPRKELGLALWRRWLERWTAG